MSENPHNPASNGHGDYEREDFTTGAVVGSLIGLIVMCVVSFSIVLGMYRYLEKSQMEHVAASPMVPMKADTRHMTPSEDKNGEDKDPVEVKAFPKPRLQDDDVKDMRIQLYGEESTLQSYGWVDQSSGEARIPIARAMELIAERGLPVRSEVAAKDSDPADPSRKKAKK